MKKIAKKKARRKAVLETPLVAYEVDNGPLTSTQYKAIGKLEPQGRMKVSKSL